MIKLNHLIKEHLIYEGLIHTSTIDKFEDIINRWNVIDGMSIITRKDNKINLQFTKNITLKELDVLLKLINNLGWFISACLVIEKNSKPNWKKFDYNEFINKDINNTLMSFQLESKYDLEVTDQIKDKLYHASPSVNDKKINKIGLVPKELSKISYHPERIYFTKIKDDLDIIVSKFNKLDKKIVPYSLYEIDIKSAMNNNRQLRLFNDPNFNNSIYTLSNIPKQYIKFIGNL